LDSHIELAFAKDVDGRKSHLVASTSNRRILLPYVYFCGRYDILEGPPLHRSATSIVVLADDHEVAKDYRYVFNKYRYDIKEAFLHLSALGYDKAADQNVASIYLRQTKSDLTTDEFVSYCESAFGKVRKVAIKFMLHRDQYRKEMELRQRFEENKSCATFVLNLLEGPETTVLEAAIASLVIDFGNKVQMKDYKYVIIMPAADRSLDAIYTSELPDDDHVRIMMKEIAESLSYCHMNGIIHCDLKMLNVVRVNGRMKLIDFDAACEIGSFACAKFSSSILPPEMFYKLVNEEEERKVELYWSSFPTDAAMIDLRKKVDPKKSWAGVFCVKSFHSGDGPVIEDLPYKLVRASPQLDIWSFGVMLYMLCAREFPLAVSRDGDLVGPHDMKTVATWEQESIQLMVRQKFKSDPVLTDLLLKLLHPDPANRLKSVDEVLSHPYFILPKDRLGDVDIIKEINDRMKRIEANGDKNLKLSLEIKQVTTEVHHVAIKTLNQIRRTEQVLLRGLFEAVDVTVPSSFVIVNIRLQPPKSSISPALGKSSEPSNSPETSNSSEPNDSPVPSNSSTSATGRFLKKLSKVGMAVSKMTVSGMTAITDGPDSLRNAINELLVNERFYVYLLDERTMMPVVVDGDKIYPIEITTPGVFIPKVLPLMKIALKAAALVNGASGIARILGYPVPCVPESYMEMAEKAVGDLDHQSSVAEFDVMQSCLDRKPHEKDENGVRTNESARGAPLREFARFLHEHDPERTYSGLRRVATLQGDSCWTTDDGFAAIRDSAIPWETEVPSDTMPIDKATVEEKSEEKSEPSALKNCESVTSDETMSIHEMSVAEKNKPSAQISSESVIADQIPPEKLLVNEINDNKKDTRTTKKIFLFFSKKKK
jgi:serine/threonine protein kinase